MSESGATQPTIGLVGALSLGIGGIVGGGFFATFGLTIAGAKGATPLAFLLGGLIALLTAYSYVGLALRYPGPGGTASYVRVAFGTGLLPAGINVLLILSYVAIMAVYAAALASYTLAYLPAGERPYAHHTVASLAVIVLGLVNFAGRSAMQRLETVFNIGKLGALAVFIVAGLLVGGIAWSRFDPAEWPAASTIIAGGMIGFLAYEGFELISNASGDIENPRRTLPIALLGSVIVAILIYMLAFVVAIGHMSFVEAETAKDFAVSAAAANFLGPAGFAIMALAAIFASASAINADYFGAAKLPVMLAENRELPSAFHRSLRGRSVVSLATIGLLALVAVNGPSITALSAATSAGFLVVYASVNLAAARLAHETGARRSIPLAAAALCLAALAVMVGEFVSSPATVGSAIAIGGILVLSLLVEVVFRATQVR